MATKTKRLLEVLLVSCEMTGVPEKALLKSRNLGSVDLVWPRAGIAKKSAAREFVFARGKVDFTGEPWAKRVLFREEVEDHTALMVSVSEPVSVQKLRKFVQLAAKYALKQGADFVEKAMLGYADLASAPVDALAAMVGEKDAPKPIAQASAAPEMPTRGTSRYTTSVRMEIWMNVATSVVFISPMPRKKPWMPLVMPGRM